MRIKAQKIGWFLFPSAPQVTKATADTVKDANWTISQERQFMEDLVYKRLTLFLTVAGALITGAISLRDNFEISIPVLFFGTILCWVLQQTVHRAQLKLDIILQILFNDETHPTGFINNILTDKNRVKWFGYLVPSVICLMLTGLTIVETILECDRAIVYMSTPKNGAAGRATITRC